MNNKNFNEGVILIINTFYEENANGENTLEEESFSLRPGIDGNKFTEVQRSIIVREKCEDCNLFSNEECTKEVCEAIGFQSGAKCSYEIQKVFSKGEATQFICKNVEWKQTDIISNDYNVNSAFEKVNALIDWYGTEGTPLNWNYEIKQFVLDLHLKGILTESQYKDLTRSNFFVPAKTLGQLREILVLRKNSLDYS